MTDHDRLPRNSFIPGQGGLGRAVDRSQERYEPSHLESRRITPHGDVSPQGNRIWPQPSMTSRVLVYGGTALGIAAVTAAGILAVRKVADLVTGNDDLDREEMRAADAARDRVHARTASSAPGFAAMPDREREEMRARARTRMRDDELARRSLREEAEAHHARPRRRRAPQQGFLEEIEHNAQRMTRTVNDVVQGVGAAVAAFRSVATQAQGVMRDFGDAADQMRGFFGSDHAQRRGTERPSDPFRRTRRSDVVDLRDDEAADDERRTHRL